jgi:hypothetical protein
LPTVRPVSAVGAVLSVTLQADTTAPSGDAEVWHNSVGCRYFEAAPSEALTADSHAIVVAWSDLDNDSAALGVVLAAKVAEVYGTATGASYPNCRVIANSSQGFAVAAEAGTTFKTICGMGLTAAKNYELVIVI